jgi:hypothetical protein
MLTIVLRVVGALLALAGLALTVAGTWFATQVGSSGTAEFTTRPGTVDPVVIRPDVLNRVDADLVVTATPAAGGSAWMALANPSDATAVLGRGRHLAVTGVSVEDWSLRTSARGSGEVVELGVADLWRVQDEGDGPVSVTVRQENAPETLVVVTDGAPLRSLTVSVTDKKWFVEAVIAALVGLFLLLAGVTMLFSRRRPTASGRREAHEGSPLDDPSLGATHEAAPAGPRDTRDPEEATR